MIKNYVLTIVTLFTLMLNAQETETFSSEEINAYIKQMDSINNTFSYQRGTVQLKNGIATLKIPEGYKYLDTKQSKRVLENLWGNPPGTTIGMLFREDENPVGVNLTYAIEIEYENDGYISDDDAKDINYEELLKDIQDDISKSNPERKKQGYPTMELVDWAAPPFYDETTKKLYWAKEMKFEGEEVNTLNYNIRILGKEGYIILNAIGDMSVFEAFNKNKDEIIASVTFNKGNKYSDFNSKTDKIAAYGIGGLIAGKVLAKAGFFAVIIKFGKFILIGFLAFFGKIKRMIFGAKENHDNTSITKRDTTQDI